MLLPLLLFVVVVLTIILVGQSVWKSFYWQWHGIRGPFGWPLGGSMWAFLVGRKHFGHIYQSIYDDYPDMPYVGLYRLFNEPAVLLRSQEMIKEVMVRNFQHFQDNVLWVDPARDPLVCCNPFIAKGEQWKGRRAELVPIFTPIKVKMCFPHIKSVCTRLLDFMGNNWQTDCLEAKELFSKFTVDVIASAGYGLDAQSFTEEDSDFVHLVEKLFLPNPYSLLDTVALLFSPALAKLMNYHYAPLSVQNWLGSIIGRILEERATLAPNRKPNDFIQWLLEAKDRTSGEPAIDRHTIIGHCSTFLLEGFETSSSLMAFACYECARHPRVQQRLHSEIVKVLGRYNNELCHEAINEMPYLEATLYETLRLYPPMMALLKHCTKSFVLPPQTREAQPFRVPVGMVMVVPVTAIHNDPCLYPEPAEFRPERFMPDNVDSQRLGCKFLGFGSGPRMCPGMRFGLAQSKAGLVAVLAKYAVHLPGPGNGRPPMQLATSTFLTAPENGVWLKFEPRVRN